MDTGGPPPRPPAQVLLVCRDAGALAMLTEGFTAQPDVSFTHATSLDAAQHRLSESDVDVALVDGALLDGEGSAWLRVLSSGPRPPSIILVASNSDQEQQASRIRDPLLHDVIPHSARSPFVINRIVRHAVEKQQLERELRISERLKVVGKFAAGVTHDISNVLTVILGTSERVYAQLPPNHPLKKDGRALRESATRAAALARQLLRFSRERPVVADDFPLGAVLQDCEPLLRALCGERVDLAIVAQEDLDVVHADRTQVEQVLLNLVANAQDALPRGGRVDVRTRVRQLEQAPYPEWDLPLGRYVELTVADNGVGMNADTQRRAFEAFFTTKAGDEGTGLGLNSVFLIVRRWGGAVQLESVPGSGTTVHVFFPAVESGGHETEPSPAQYSQAESGAGRTVLVVEDEEGVRELVTDILGDQGFDVLAVSRPTLALDICRDHEGPIHLLVTDIVLPDMNGLELAEQVRSVRPGIQVLYMSGYADRTDLAGGSLAEGMRLISKPFDVKSLVRSVREALDDDSATPG